MSCCFFYFWRQFEKIFVSLDGTAVPVSTCLHVRQVKSKLKGHQKRITGLAFSNALNVLVSSGADAQVLIFQSLSITSMYKDPVLQKIVLSSMEFWLHISLVPPGRMCLFSYFLLLHCCPRCFCQNEVSTVTLLTQMM
jgi:WD40 repeat protein